MSLRAICKTQLSDEADLIASVEGIYGKDKISVLEDTGVDGMPRIMVNISGLYGPAGFAKNADGKYELVYDSSDKLRLKELIPQKQADGTIKDRLSQSYANIRTLKGIKQIKNFQDFQSNYNC